MAFNPSDHFLNLKGKNYLQVMWRLVWFREEHPDWSIQTNLIEHGDGYAVFKAEIIEPHTEQVISTGYGSESVKDFGDYLEKAETKAVGRALAMLGYGTQFAPELDEGERIVDSPVERKPKAATPDPASVPAYPKTPKVCESCGSEINDKIEEYSLRVFKKRLCINCQKKGGAH